MLTNGKKYTLACWVKVTGVNDNGWAIKLGTAQNGLWWAKSTPRWVWNENDNGKRVIGTPIADDYTNWHHLVTTVDKTNSAAITAKHYVDGQPAEGYASQTWNNGSFALPAGDKIIIYPQNAQLCDIRLYDNVLTDEEVKEIAKGLILHYPLAGYPNSNILNKPHVRLPVEYQEVEYIQNDPSGNAYIDLNYTPTVPFTSINMNGTIAISQLDNARNFICTVGSGAHSHYFEINATHKIGCYDITSTDTVSNNERINFKSIIEPSRLTVTAWGDSAYLNNKSSTAYASSDDITPVLLFRLANNYKGRNIKFYKYNLLENNILKFYLIPCYRISDNKPGMYDLVNRTFYTNAGTGEFILGPLVSIPDEYMAVDYLSMKRGSYIDTGISVTSTHQFNFKYSVQSIVQWYGPFQAYTDENSMTTRIIANSTSTTNIFVYFMSRAGSGGAPAVNNVYSGNNDIIEGYMNYNNTYLYNHTTQKEFNITNNHVTGTASTAHMLLSGQASSAGRSKIYYFDTYNNDVLVQALRPVIRISDRKPGMYDLVTGTFFVNQGSNEEFTYSSQAIEYNIVRNEHNNIYTNDVNTLLAGSDPVAIRYPKYFKFTGSKSLYDTTFSYNTNTQNIWSTSIWFYYTAQTNTLQTLYAIHQPNAQADANTKVRPMITASSTANSLSVFAEGKYITISNLTTNMWHHLVCTCDGTTFTAYLDGESKGTATSLTFKSNTNLLIIGAYGTNKLTSPLTNGSVSDFRFYTTCLSADDVLKLYQMGNPN